MPEEAHESELERAISDAETDGRAEVGDTEVERQPGQQFYEPRFEPLANMSCRSISEMTDGQLEAYILRYQELVGEAEQALETRKAKLGAARLEKGERAKPERKKSPHRIGIEQAIALAAERKGLGQPTEGIGAVKTRRAPKLPSPKNRPTQEPGDTLLEAYWAKKRGNGDQK